MMCGGKIIPFIVNEPKLELDYPEDIPRIEQALERLERGESLGPGPDCSGDRHPV